MAKNSAVWGIDIGQAAVKALRCRPGDTPDQIQADAFDYIEYPKILSQPEADPVALVKEALEQFLSRNSVRGDRVAISVPGQNGLARFIKLPPVESKKIPDIVRYEAKQQIPFALEDVVWDYQQMAGGSEHEGFALETEVGLFAMKREQVFRVLKPFRDAGIEVDFVQLAPLAVYNYVVFDQMQDLPPADQYDPDSPPESVVVLAMGTDSTDLVVTNGYRVWQRSVPLGGNHFTKALTKELKLTFAKAEHLKRNASHADDPKAVFQAMRPVFSDLVTEIQRSIGYYANIDKRAKISRIVAVGNAMKMPGLQRFLAQNLGMEVDRVETFRGLSGPGVVDAPAFTENIGSFAVCYGLALQALSDVRIRTNLIPPEIVTERIIRRKKPWAVGAAAALLAGLAVSFLGEWRAWSLVHEDRFGSAVTAADAVVTEASGHKSAYESAKADLVKTQEVGTNLVHNVEGRVMWLEVLKAINICLPTDEVAGNEDEAAAAEEEETAESVAKKNQLHISQIDCQRVPDLAFWYQNVKRWYRNPEVGQKPPATPADPAAAGDAAAADPAATPAVPPPPAAGETTGGAAADEGPTGPGWIFQMVGHHYHNNMADLNSDKGAEYVYNTLIKNLHQPSIEIPNPAGEGTISYPVGDLGIAYAVILNPEPINRDFEVELPEEIEEEDEGEDAEGDDAEDGDADDGDADARPRAVRVPGANAGFGAMRPGMGPGLAGPGVGGPGQEVRRTRKQPRFDFIVQFCWTETPSTKRNGEEPKADAAPETVAAMPARREEN